MNYKLDVDSVEIQLIMQDIFSMEILDEILLEIEDGEYEVIYDKEDNIYKVTTKKGHKFEVI